MATPSMREGGEAAEESISCLQPRQSLCPSCVCPRPGASALAGSVGHPQSHDPCCHIVSCCFLLHSPSCLRGQKGSSCPQKSSLTSLKGWGCTWWWERGLQTGRPESGPPAPRRMRSSAACYVISASRVTHLSLHFLVCLVWIIG